MTSSASLTRYARAGAIAILAICAVAQTGWLLGVPVLSSVIPGWPRMAPFVIVCFLLSVVGLIASTMPPERKEFDRVRIVTMTLVLIICACALIDYIVTGGLRGAANAGAINLFGGKLGRPSPASAINFIAAAIALLLPRQQRWGRLYGTLIALGLVITGLDFVGYSYGIAALSRGPTVSAMSLPTVSCFILFFGCAMLARPYDGWTAILFAPNSGGSAARRLFPAMMILPFIVNGMVVLAYRFRPFEAPFGFAVLSVATTVGLGIIIITIANGLGRHEEERLRSEGMLEAIVENSLSIIFVKDLAGRYRMVNRRFLETFRVERDAVIGKTDYDIFSQYEAASFRAMDQRVIQAGQPLMGEELVSQADGFHTYVSIKAPLKDAAGRPYGVFGISTDITDKKRSEKALAAAKPQDAGA